MLIWLASYPRSGNGFLRQLLKRVYGQKTYSVYEHESSSIHADDFPGPSLEKMPDCDELYFVKTHDLPPDDVHPAIYLVRDGRDSLISYTHFVLHPPNQEESAPIPPEEFRETLQMLIDARLSPFGVWSQSVDAWTARPSTAVIKFEELIAEPRIHVQRAIAQLKLPIEEKPGAATPTFEELRRPMPRLFRQGKVGTWRDEFPADLLKDFWRIHGATMKRCGYTKHDAHMFVQSSAEAPPISSSNAAASC